MKQFTFLIGLLFVGMNLSAQEIWNVKAIDPSGQFIDVKAIDKSGKLLDVKALEVDHNL